MPTATKENISHLLKCSGGLGLLFIWGRTMANCLRRLINRFKFRSGFAQARRHNKNLAQPLFERDGLLRAKPGAYPASQTGAFIALGPSRFVQRNGICRAALHADAAAGAGLRVDHRKIERRIDQGERAVSPEPQSIAAIFTAVADACFRAGFSGTRVKCLMNQPGFFRSLHDFQGFLL